MNAFLVDLENKPGELARVTEAIAAKGVNITNLTGTTCGSSGRLLLTTDNESATRAALSASNCTFETKELVETPMRHQPGALAAVARRLANAGINIEGMCPTGMQGQDLTVGFVTDQPARTKELLSHATMSG